MYGFWMGLLQDVFLDVRGEASPVGMPGRGPWREDLSSASAAGHRGSRGAHGARPIAKSRICSSALRRRLARLRARSIARPPPGSSGWPVPTLALRGLAHLWRRPESQRKSPSAAADRSWRYRSFTAPRIGSADRATCDTSNETLEHDRADRLQHAERQRERKNTPASTQASRPENRPSGRHGPALR
jgi:hypothetical protein